MTEKKVAKRSLMKPFIKAINFSHIMPTRYQVIKKILSLNTRSAPLSVSLFNISSPPPGHVFFCIFV
jgi:hypothetical protein